MVEHETAPAQGLTFGYAPRTPTPTGQATPVPPMPQ